MPRPADFWGNNENEPQKTDTEKNEKKGRPFLNKNSKKTKQKNPAICCTLCNIEMSKARTKFRIEAWERSNQKFTEDEKGNLGMELPTTLYLCPKCGKLS